MSLDLGKIFNKVLQEESQRILRIVRKLRPISILRLTWRELCESCSNEECPKTGYIRYCEWKPKED